MLQVIDQYRCPPANPRKIKSISHVIFRLIKKLRGLNAVPHEWSEPGRQAKLVVIMACLDQYHPGLYRLVEHYPRFYEELRLWANGDRVEFEHEVFSAGTSSSAWPGRPAVPTRTSVGRRCREWSTLDRRA